RFTRLAVLGFLAEKIFPPITKLGTKLKNGLEAPLRSRPISHDHDGYEHTFSHTLFAAPYMPPVHSSFNPLKAGPWLGMTNLSFPRRCRRAPRGHWGALAAIL